MKTKFRLFDNNNKKNIHGKRVIGEVSAFSNFFFYSFKVATSER